MESAPFVRSENILKGNSKDIKVVALTSIIELLESPRTASEIMKALNIPKKNLERKLEMIKKICKRKGWEFKYYPARCRSCGYEFSRKEIKIPSKCPRCSSEWLDEPIFLIEK